ncbi:MAG: hypothetical protein ACRC62_17190 [Microcoleus sp.]
MHDLSTGSHSSPSRKPSGGFQLTSLVETQCATIFTQIVSSVDVAAISKAVNSIPSGG